MKYLFTLLLLLFSVTLFAQTKTVTVDVNDLPQNLRATIEQEAERQAMQHKVQAYGEWVGLGKEIGSAVDGSLSALTTNAIDFSQTDLGKITMALVIFKVAGEDLIGILIGALMMLTLIPLSSFYLFKKTRTKTLIKGSRLRGTAEYQLTNYRADFLAGAVGLWAVCNLAIIAISCAIMFA